MRPFLLHVLHSGFHRIQHYGFLANANRKHDIPAVRINRRLRFPLIRAAAPITVAADLPSSVGIAVPR